MRQQQETEANRGFDISKAEAKPCRDTLMPAIRFFCHSAWGYREITCDSGTSVRFAAKCAAAAFFLDPHLAWILSEKIPDGRVLDNDELMAPFADKQLFLSPARNC